MERYFNTEGICWPDMHYMVPLDERLEKIKGLFVDRGKYFIINRGRQYGKTTTLQALAAYLKNDYTVIALDFQELSTSNFENEDKFVASFIRIFISAIKTIIDNSESHELQEALTLFSDVRMDMGELFVNISKICEISQKPVVLMIDEVDSASNNQVFIDFLAMLRRYYLDRKNKPIFHSVILAGVYDIKNLKLKIRPDEEHQYNSPWNFAVKFDIDMSFQAEQIAVMLREYEEDKHTGMDVSVISKCIYDYTSGYPYFVSAVCKIIDEELPETERFADGKNAWTKEGIAEAVKVILMEKATLFDSMAKQLDVYSDLRGMLEEVIYQGKRIPYSTLVRSVNLGLMFGYVKADDGYITVANRIFEMALLDMFMAEEACQSEAYRYGQRDRNQFICNGRLNMDLVLEKFVEHYNDIYGESDEKFIEAYGRKFFLLYLKPIINGTGNYYLEAHTRDARRTDVIVDYLGEQFIVELKIWHGNEYNERGEAQLTGYLDYYHQQKGYMLSFIFNKRKEVGIKEIQIGDKIIMEAVV